MTKEQDKISRNLTCFIQSFCDDTAEQPVPHIFKEWAAISAIAGVLQRKVWFRAAFGVLYPSDYILLLAPPGGGKSTIISYVERLWFGLQSPDMHIFVGDLTKASMVDKLQEATVTAITPSTRPYMYSSLNIASSEFGNLMKANDLEYLNFLNDIWDCREVYQEGRRSRQESFLQIDKPQVNLLAGTQPSYLSNIMPDQSFGYGFPFTLYAGVQ